MYVRCSKEGIHRTFADVDGDKMVARRIGKNSDARDCHGEIVRAIFIIVFNLVVDLLYALIDPRVRLG